MSLYLYAAREEPNTGWSPSPLSDAAVISKSEDEAEEEMEAELPKVPYDNGCEENAVSGVGVVGWLWLSPLLLLLFPPWSFAVP